MKRNLIYYMHQSLTTNSGPSALIEMMNDYKLIDGNYDFAEACLLSSIDCKNTYLALSILDSSETFWKKNLERVTYHSGEPSKFKPLDMGTIEFIASKMAANSLNPNFHLASSVYNCRSANELKTLKTILQKYGRLTFNNAAKFNETVLSSALTTNRTGVPATHFIQFLRSENVAIEEIKISFYGVLQGLTFLEDNGVDTQKIVKHNEARIVSSMVSGGEHNFKSTADKFPGLFKEHFIIHLMNNMSFRLTTAQYLGYLVEKNIVTKNIKATNYSLISILKEFNETKHLARILR